jgi:hypothetical protein
MTGAIEKNSILHANTITSSYQVILFKIIMLYSSFFLHLYQ